MQRDTTDKPITGLCSGPGSPSQRGVLGARQLGHKQGRLLTWKQSSVALPPALRTLRELTRFILQPRHGHARTNPSAHGQPTQETPRVASPALGILGTLQLGEWAFLSPVPSLTGFSAWGVPHFSARFTALINTAIPATF